MGGFALTEKIEFLPYVKVLNGCVRITGKNRDFPYGKITIFPGNANTPNANPPSVPLLLNCAFVK